MNGFSLKNIMHTETFEFDTAQELWEFLDGDPTLEPALCRMADGMADRVDRLRCCGNGVVPLVAAYAFRALDARLRADGPHTGELVLREAAE